MLTVRLDKQLEAAIARTGSTKSSVVREALLRYLEDIDDAALVAQAKRAGVRAKSIAAIRKAIGLS